MWHATIYGPGKLAWSVKHPGGVVYTRGSFAEAVETAQALSHEMKAHSIGHYRCRVYKTALT